jgi:hypothetical protein
MITVTLELVLLLATLLSTSLIGAINGVLNWYHKVDIRMKYSMYAFYVMATTVIVAPDFVPAKKALPVATIGVIAVAEIVERNIDGIFDIVYRHLDQGI